MLRLTDDLRFYLYTGKVNLRMGCMRTCELIRTQMKSDPRDSRNVYVFINRTCSIIRLIHFERGFYVMYEKRPESGKFRKPVYDANSGKYKISYSDLVCLTESIARTDIKLLESADEAINI